MKRILLLVGLVMICAGLSEVNPPKIVHVLKIKNNTGLALKVQLYFLYDNPATNNQERVFPCLQEVHLNEQMPEWTCKKAYMFPALPNLDRLRHKLKGVALAKAEQIVGPYLDVEGLDQNIRVKAILQKRVLPAGIYSIEKLSEQTVQIKEKPVTEVTIDAVPQ